MRLTPLAKAFIAVVVVAVIGFATWHYKGDAIKEWAGGERVAGEDSKGDFDKLNNAPGDPARNAGSTGVNATTIGSGRLNRPLVVGINTWAGHAPGIVFNNGMDPNAGSQYKSKYGIDALSSIKSVEDLKGKKIACTQFTPSHFLLLYLLSQSGLTPDERAGVERNIVFTQDAPAAAAAFKAGQVDAAVTWEPDLSGAVAARGSEAHVLVSTQAATNIIADTLCARQQVIDQAPETVRDFVRGWLDGIELIKNNPNGSYEVVGKALKLDNETVSGMLSGLKLTPYADNAQFYGLTGAKAHYETLFDTAFVIWRKKGLVTKSVDAKNWADARFLQAVASAYPGQKVEEAPVVAKAPSSRDVPILHQQIQIQFTPGSDEIMPGSYLLLDKLGETMTSFGSTVLRVEGNTDSTGSATGNLSLSERRALSVKNYIVKNFPNIPPTRFQTIGRGASNPIAEKTTEAGRQQNRRTDIKVILATS